MYAATAQVIALANFGNAWLADTPAFDLDAFVTGNSHLNSTKFVRFVEGESVIAADPAAWFKRLKDDGIRALRVRKDNSSGRWLIEAIGQASSDFWNASWDAGVTYARTAKGKPTAALTADAQALRSKLASTLAASAEFARSQNSGFATLFEAGVAAINGDASEGDLAPPGALPLTARQLLAAVRAAWVFGGMGSWNDQSFEGAAGDTHSRLSTALYQQFTDAIFTAVLVSAPR